MGISRAFTTTEYFKSEPTFGRINNMFDLYKYIACFISHLQQEKYRIAGGCVYDDLYDDWAEAVSNEDLGGLALGGLISMQLGLIERIYPDMSGIDPAETEIYAVTTEGAEWLERYCEALLESNAEQMGSLYEDAWNKADRAEQADPEAER